MTNGLYTQWLPDERYTWRMEIELGIWHEPYILKQYRLNRDSTLWRSTREVEKLCEYILHLEGANPMSTVTTFKCDMCEKDLTAGTKDHMFRLNLFENLMPYETEPDEEQPVLKPELDEMKHFCNIACLKGWLNKE